jgi:hypothetical protein
MIIFLEYCQDDYNTLDNEYKPKGGISSLVLRGIVKLAKKEVERKCDGKCQKIKKGYDIPPDIEENLKAMADNEGISVARLVEKHVIFPTLKELKR